MRATEASDSGTSESVAAVVNNRARSTSASRAAPRAWASQLSSARRLAVQSRSNTAVKVRRSLRRRRQPTRIWCTAVSPLPTAARSRTSGSCATMRATSR